MSFLQIVYTVFSMALAGLAPSAYAQDADTVIHNTENGTPYLSGGITADERSQLQNHEKDFNLKLIFTEVNGGYLSDVKVAINDTAGNSLLQTTTEGPLFYTHLAPGKYTLTLENDGKIQTKEVTLLGTDKLDTINFSWSH